MRFKVILLIFGLIFLAGNSYCFDTTKVINKLKIKVPEERNKWNLAVVYGDKGFGIEGGLFKNIGRDVDLFANLSISGVSDSREIEIIDNYGNIVVANKENRIFLIPLNIGIQAYLFRDDLDGSLRPYITAGISPSFIITNPYDKSYFKAFAYAQPSFAFGGFVGLGLEFVQTKGMSLGIGAKYFYLPVIGREINSLRNTPIKDVGGIQLCFGLNFTR